MKTDTLIDFIGIGAQKAATTWLYEKLRLHPKVAFPAGKEIHFWDLNYCRGLEWYRSRFDTRKICGTRFGEITPAYAILAPDKIRECYKNVPNIKLIYLLRNPMERAWSSAKMALARAEMEISEASNQWFIDHFKSRGSMMRGDYEQCLRSWLSVYPEQQLLLCYYEDLKAEPEALLRRCFRHIGVEDDNYDWSVDLKSKVFASQDYPLPDHLRLELQRIYLPKIASLERYLGKDLSGWQ